MTSQTLEILLPALLVICIAILSWPAMTAPLLLDDNDQLDFVSSYGSWKDSFSPDVYGLFRPLKNLIFYNFQDVSLIQWHSFAIFWYLAATLAVYFLFRHLFKSSVWGLIGAALWASSPTQVSTMAWLSAVNLSISMVFACACLIAHDSLQTRGSRNFVWILVTGTFLALALLSYETAVSVPVLCVLMDLFRKRSIFSREAILRYGVLGFITICYLTVRLHYGSTHSVEELNYGIEPDLKAWQLSASAPWFLWRHFSMWFMPLGRLEFFSGYIWGKSASFTTLILSGAWVLGMLLAAGATWRRLPIISLGLLWFLVASFPPSNFIPIWSGPIQDYYLFFPSIGLTILLIGIIKLLLSIAQDSKVGAKKTVAFSLLLLVAFLRLGCVPLFWLQADLWNRPLELFLRAEQSRPYQHHLKFIASHELLEMDRISEAKLLAQASLADAPWHAGANMIFGFILFKENNFKEAASHLGRAVEGSPRTTDLHNFSRFYLAATLERTGESTTRIREILFPLLSDPIQSWHEESIGLLIHSYKTRDQPEDALRAAKRAVSMHPEDQKFSKMLADLEKDFPAEAAETTPPAE